MSFKLTAQSDATLEKVLSHAAKVLDDSTPEGTTAVHFTREKQLDALQIAVRDEQKTEAYTIRKTGHQHIASFLGRLHEYLEEVGGEWDELRKIMTLEKSAPKAKASKRAASSVPSLPSNLDSQAVADYEAKAEEAAAEVDERDGEADAAKKEYDTKRVAYDKAVKAAAAAKSTADAAVLQHRASKRSKGAAASVAKPKAPAVEETFDSFIESLTPKQMTLLRSVGAVVGFNLAVGHIFVAEEIEQFSVKEQKGLMKHGLSV